MAARTFWAPPDHVLVIIAPSPSLPSHVLYLMHVVSVDSGQVLCGVGNTVVVSNLESEVYGCAWDGCQAQNRTSSLAFRPESGDVAQW